VILFALSVAFVIQIQRDVRAKKALLAEIVRKGAAHMGCLGLIIPVPTTLRMM
jgi:hypothetical protein